MDGDGAASFFAYLQAYDFRGVNLRKPPVTAALLDQKLLSLESVSRWWRDRLWNGYIDNPDAPRVPFRSVDGEIKVEVEDGTVWLNTVPCARLFASYAAFCKRSSVRYPETEEGFARKLREFASMERKRGPRDADGKRAWMYAFPGDLADIRGQFEKWIGGALSWTGDESSVVDELEYATQSLNEPECEPEADAATQTPKPVPVHRMGWMHKPDKIDSEIPF